MNCPKCGTDIPQGFSECFFCGNIIEQVVRKSSVAKARPDDLKDYAYAFMGISSAILAVFFVPFIFGVIGIVSGSRIMKGHRKALGMAIIIVSLLGFGIGTLRERIYI